MFAVWRSDKTLWPMVPEQAGKGSPAMPLSRWRINRAEGASCSGYAPGIGGTGSTGGDAEEPGVTEPGRAAAQAQC